MPKTLLVSCCAPCSCAVIEKLAREGADFTVLFYNPNIAPESEYVKRRDEQKRLCERFGAPFVDLEYDPENWARTVRGLEDLPERAARCSRCFYMRLKRAAEYAKENGFDAVTSVFGVSRHKDFNQVCEAGKKACAGVVPYDTTNWRKGGLENRRPQLIKELDLYEQDYCGCPYSARKAKPHVVSSDEKA